MMHEIKIDVGENLESEVLVRIRGSNDDVLELIGRITVMLRNERARLAAERAAGKPEPCGGCGE